MLPNLNAIQSIYIHKEPVDLRKGIDGYMSLVQMDLSLDPYDGSLFLFTNRTHNKVKGILYTGTGFWLLYFRPEKGTFK